MDEALDALLHNRDYYKRTLIDCEQFALACTTYPSYPLLVLNLPEFTVVVEGKLYGLTDTDLPKQMERLAGILFEERARNDGRLVAWLLSADGDFIIFFLRKKTNEIIVLNDAIGRLPWYCYRVGEDVILSREMRFIVRMLEEIQFDRMGIAQSLLFGYPLGNRTLIENVQRLTPATLVRISGSTYETSALHTFNFDFKEHRQRTVEDNASELVRLFRESCRQRASQVSTNVVSLSGGLDSRAVAAGLYEERVPFIGITFLEHDRTGSPDMTIASQLAKLYHWDWEGYLLDSPRGRHVLQLLRIKNGLVHLGMSFIILFFERIKEKHGDVTYFTGDGGDKVLPSQTTRTFSNIEQVADAIVKTHQMSPLETVTELTKLSEAEIKRELLAHLADYPEQDLRQKYVHFMIYERAMKWLFEGEDRNRFYFWTAAPFYSVRFFVYAMNCPESQKIRNLLYRRFLEQLSKPTTEVVTTDVRLPPNSFLYGASQSAKLLLIDWLPRNLKARLKRESPYDSRSTIVKCLREQVETCASVKACLSSESLKDLIENSSGYSRNELEYLFSITSIIEDFSVGHSSIDHYLDTAFV
jgi:asparagine synthase (glutamine-hydrolysing)